MSNRRVLGIAVAFLAVCSILFVAGAVAETDGSARSADRGAGFAAVQGEQFTISDVTLDQTTVTVGEPVSIEGIVENQGAEAADIELTLAANGESVETRTARTVQPEFPVIAQFEWTPTEPGTYQLAINGVDAESQLVVEASDGSDGQANDQGQTDGGDTDDSPSQDQFSVLEVRLTENETVVGDTTTVVADIGNNGDQRGDYEVTLEVDGEPVQTETVEEVLTQIEVGAQAQFDYEPNETGTYTISVNGVEAESELVVESGGGGGGGPFGIFGIFGFLGFLPLGLLRPLLLFIGLPLLVIYLALKGLALYLGY